MRGRAGTGRQSPAAESAFNRGIWLAERERLVQARKAYQAAIDSGHAEYGPRAAIALAELLERAGDGARACTAYQAAIDSGHAEYGPRGAMGLGGLLASQGELSGAQTAYQAAMDSGHPEIAPGAADALGMMLAANQDDPRAIDAAVVAFRHAAESGHPNYARGSGWTLGMLLGLRGDFPGARAAFRLSAQAGPPTAMPGTMINYAGTLACEFGDFEGAATFLMEIIDSADLDYAREARAELDMITAADGDLDVYRRAVDATWVETGWSDQLS